jgi:sortase (surface protein transpeptidase)
MPAVSRPTRSIVALALVVNIVAAGAPVSAGTAPRVAPTGATAPIVASAPSSPRDLGSRSSGTGSPATRAVAERAVRAEAVTQARAAAAPRAIGVAKATKPPAKSAKLATPAAVRSTSYRGRNHVWIPALGVSRAVTFYACSSSYYPGNRVYRWGCAGSNNVYLFGHAHSVFKALHDAYVRGRMRKGMKVIYANGAGKVSTYAVSWWKLTTPDKGAWAFASQSSPSLTLQTCVGANNKYRLIVRLRRVG